MGADELAFGREEDLTTVRLCAVEPAKSHRGEESQFQRFIENVFAVHSVQNMHKGGVGDSGGGRHRVVF